MYWLKWTGKGRIPSYQGGPPIPYRCWTDTETRPVLCERGWHACRWEDVASHISDRLRPLDPAVTFSAAADDAAVPAAADPILGHPPDRGALPRTACGGGRQRPRGPARRYTAAFEGRHLT